MNEYENLHTHGHYYRFLYDLQRSGRTNMHGAVPYLIQRFGLEKNEARDILLHWMDQYEVIANKLGIEV